MFEEEKRVAEKAPVNEIQMDVLGEKKTEVKNNPVSGMNYKPLVDKCWQLMADQLHSDFVSIPYSFFTISSIVSSAVLVVSSGICFYIL